MNLTLKVWKQKNTKAGGSFEKVARPQAASKKSEQ